MTYTDELRELSEAAECGDSVAGEKLLNLFATLAEEPEGAHVELVRHVARCVKRYVELDSVRQRDGAAKAFCIQKPRKRPQLLTPNRNHVDALVVFYKARHEGDTFEEAKRKGAAAGNISEETMHDLTRTKKKTRMAILEEFSAILELSTEQKEFFAGQVK